MRETPSSLTPSSSSVLQRTIDRVEECLPVRGHEHAPFEMVPTDLLRDALALLRSQAEEIARMREKLERLEGR